MKTINWAQRDGNYVSIPVGARVMHSSHLNDPDDSCVGVVVDKTAEPVTTRRDRDYEPVCRYYGSAVMFKGSAVAQWISDADLSVCD